jgi:hypothetical protein
MHHQPKPGVFVRLNFYEMITASERRELGLSLLSTDGVQVRVAESIVCDALRLRNDRASISPAGGHSMAKFSQNLAGDLRGMQGSCVNIEGNGKHPTSNVTSYCLWIDEV